MQRNSTKPCAVEGCNRFTEAREWCQMHYRRWKQHGDPGSAERQWDFSNPSAGEKACTLCGRVLPLEAFSPHRGKRDGRTSRCRECFNERARNGWLLRTYGITSERYDAMLSEQDHKCAICGQSGNGGQRRKLAVDHDHETGQVRALLCVMCNVMLGNARDEPETLRAAARYIEHHR